MQKISELTTTADSSGEFTNGSVSSGVSPTNLDAGWFNTIQRELVAIVEGAGLTLDSTDDTQVLAAIKSLVGGGRYLNSQKFTSSGTYTPTTGTKKVRVRVWGAGAGGQGMSAIDQGITSGAAGAYAESIIDVSSVTSVTVVVGSGGTSVAAKSNAYGGTGGTSKFGSYITCTGGSTTSSGTSGGTATGGTVFNIDGQGGQGAQFNSTISVLIGGTGGCAYGAYGALAHTSKAGDSGGYPGGGGAVGVYCSSSVYFASGAGANGLVIIDEYS